jgi:outer membrane protein assembly factor BamB
MLFLFHDQGTVSCLRAATGETLWSEKPAGRYFGSPVRVGGNLYCITVDGEVVVLKAAPKYELLAVNPLDEKSQATPAVANGRMYLRTLSHLMCIGGER